VNVLDSTSFDRSAEKVAHDLIGRRLNWRRGDKPESRIITETEAYTAAVVLTPTSRCCFDCSARFQAPSSLPEIDRVTLHKIDYRFPKEGNRSQFGQ
jgi:hypothetical protein